MESKPICPSCQKPLAPDVPMGLCPECLIKAGLPSGLESEAGVPSPAFVPPSVEELAKNFPQLEIIELIGKGGMGAVYKARQTKLNRVVALKILPPAISSKPAFAERFTREAQALAQLNHPGIVTLYEFGEANGLFYFLMEFVDGVTLRQLLQAGRVSPREALAIVPQICDALQYAHDQGIVHRDIKPENILLDRRGRVKVADFGLAKIVGVQGDEKSASGEVVQSSVTLTDMSKVMGTPQYMSPEQISAPGEVDHRADIYALGVVFYQMLTGELPEKNLEPPSKKVQIDVRLDEVVLRALETKPELRYQQASVFKTQVETIASSLGAPESAGTEDQLSSEKIQEPPPPPLPVPPASAGSGNGRNRLLPPAIGLILAGILTVFGMLAAGAFMGIAAYRVNYNAENRVKWASASAQAAQTELNRAREAQAALQVKMESLKGDTSEEATEERLEYQERSRVMANEIHKAETMLAATQEQVRIAQRLSLRDVWGALIYIGPVVILAGLLSGALTIFGAVKMLRQNRRWGYVASILGMITPPGFLLGVPSGIWALIVLSKRSEPGGRKIEGSVSPTSQTVNNHLLAPAIGLMLAGVLTVLGILASGAFMGIAIYQLNRRAEKMAAEYRINAQAGEANLVQLRKFAASLQSQIDAAAKDSNEAARLRVTQSKVAEDIAQKEAWLAKIRERERELSPFSLKKTVGPSIRIHAFGGDDALFYWLPVLLLACLISGILTIKGAIQMLRSNRRWGIAASILGMITPPGLLLGLPFGIWALIVLSQRSEPDGRKTEGSVSPSTKPVNNNLLAPAIGLMLAGVLTVLGILASGAFMGIEREAQAALQVKMDSVKGIRVHAFGGDDALFYWLPVLLLAGLISGILTIKGAIQMLRSDRRWGIAASILGIITPPGLLLGLPFGIWALAALSQENGQNEGGGDINEPSNAPVDTGSQGVKDTTRRGQAWLVYISCAAAVLPMILLWTFCLVYIVPRLKENALHYPENYHPFSEFPWTGFMDFLTNYWTPSACIGVIVLVVITELCVPFWRRHRRKFAWSTVLFINVVTLITLIGMFVLAIQGPKKRLASHASAAQPALSTNRFGPVIERTLAGEGDANKRYIDLDSGKLFAASEFFGPNAEPSPEETQKWWRSTGIDAVADTSPGQRGLVGFEMVAVPVPDKVWEETAPKALDYYFGATTPGTPALMWGKDVPATFAIKTREGGRGVLQIFGFSDNPPGIKIRYKVAQESTPSSDGAK